MPETYSTLKHNSLVVNAFNGLMNRRTKKVDGYVFVATTGRSGSESLARIFGAADRAITMHEPAPVMFSDYPDPEIKVEYFRKLFFTKKRIHIKRLAAGHRYYVETNHQFLKNFIDFAVEEFGDKLRIIHMYRDPVKVASSFFSINSIPGTTDVGKTYLLYPVHKDNRIQISDLLMGSPEFDHDLYKCLWYWYEIQTRVKEYKEKYPAVRWHTMQTDQLNDESSLQTMFDSLKIAYDPAKLKDLVGSRVNVKTELKKKKVQVEEAAEMHQKLLAKMEERYGKDFWK
ncbi:hypothetical protein GF377_05930 [candidate division GN15 bacterium]|nr:hypothetical protein [candidate division GN15 bacterium]